MPGAIEGMFVPDKTQNLPEKYNVTLDKTSKAIVRSNRVNHHTCNLFFILCTGLNSD